MSGRANHDFFSFTILGQDSGGYLVLQRDGSQNNGWHEAQISLASEVNFTLVIESTRGSGIYGDIAIDDISFHEGPCGKTLISCLCTDILLSGYFKSSWMLHTVACQISRVPRENHFNGIPLNTHSPLIYHAL